MWWYSDTSDDIQTKGDDIQTQMMLFRHKWWYSDTRWWYSDTMWWYSDTGDDIQTKGDDIQTQMMIFRHKLISTSAEGLQESLNWLHAFCYRWGLEVNADKTKIIVVGKSSQRTHLMFHFGNAEIENVKEFTYLGFQISSNGNMKATIADRHSKASKMANVILRAINTNNNINVRLAMRLFTNRLFPYYCMAVPFGQSLKSTL